jgi:3-hydroxyacyl-CoA dehydrogenase/enoyl-CoA hydratase/3-hydroxybutyryl-CoA epimerase
VLSKNHDELGFRDDTLTPIQRRLVYPMLIEAVRCLELGIVDQPWAVDLAMVLGTGFAPHRGGPLHMIDAIGRDTFTSNLIQLRSLHGGRFSTPHFTYGAARMVDDCQTY